MQGTEAGPSGDWSKGPEAGAGMLSLKTKEPRDWLGTPHSSSESPVDRTQQQTGSAGRGPTERRAVSAAGDDQSQRRKDPTPVPTNHPQMPREHQAEQRRHLVPPGPPQAA